MSSTVRGSEYDYPRLTKLGVAGGTALFAVGMLAEWLLRTTGALTPTLNDVFLTMEFLGPLVAVLSVFVFGIAMPLTE